MVVVMCFATMTDATAELAVPLVVALAVVGFGVGGARPPRAIRPGSRASRRRGVCRATPRRPSRPARPTFAGYVKLDDTATWLGTLDYVLEHGTQRHGPRAVDLRGDADVLAGRRVPDRQLLPLGVTQLVDVDPAWTWQPYLSFLAALLALVLYELVGGSSARASCAPLVAVTASASALLYGYALWGGVKELYAAVLLGAARRDRCRYAGEDAYGRRSSRRSPPRVPRRPQRGGSDLARPARRRRPRRRLATSRRW